MEISDSRKFPAALIALLLTLLLVTTCDSGGEGWSVNYEFTAISEDFFKAFDAGLVDGEPWVCVVAASFDPGSASQKTVMHAFRATADPPLSKSDWKLEPVEPPGPVMEGCRVMDVGGLPVMVAKGSDQSVEALFPDSGSATQGFAGPWTPMSLAAAAPKETSEYTGGEVYSVLREPVIDRNYLAYELEGGRSYGTDSLMVAGLQRTKGAVSMAQAAELDPEREFNEWGLVEAGQGFPSVWFKDLEGDTYHIAVPRESNRGVTGWDVHDLNLDARRGLEWMGRRDGELLAVDLHPDGAHLKTAQIPSGWTSDPGWSTTVIALDGTTMMSSYDVAWQDDELRVAYHTPGREFLQAVQREYQSSTGGGSKSLQQEIEEVRDANQKHEDKKELNLLEVSAGKSNGNWEVLDESVAAQPGEVDVEKLRLHPLSSGERLMFAEFSDLGAAIDMNNPGASRQSLQNARGRWLEVFISEPPESGG